MHRFQKQNVNGFQIIHPRRDFLISVVPSLVLAGLIVYGVLSLWLTVNYFNSAQKGVQGLGVQHSDLLPPTPTPTITVVPSTLPGDETVVKTLSVPTTVVFAPVGSVGGDAVNEQTAAVKTTVAEINHALQHNDNQELYKLLSSQLTAIFSADSVAKAMGGLGDDAGLQLVGEPQISGEWAKQQVSYVDNGKTTQYLAVLHLEDGAWKLFGTASVE